MKPGRLAEYLALWPLLLLVLFHFAGLFCASSFRGQPEDAIMAGDSEKTTRPLKKPTVLRASLLSSHGEEA